MSLAGRKWGNMNKNFIMIGLGILKFFDVGTTYVGVGIQTGTEQNPLMNYVIQQTSLLGMLTLSLMIALTAHYFLLYPPKIFKFKTLTRKNNYQMIAVLLMYITYAFVIISNFKTIIVQ